MAYFFIFISIRVLGLSVDVMTWFFILIVLLIFELVKDEYLHPHMSLRS